MGTYIIKKRRSSYYYFRVVIPKDLRPILIKRTIVISLRTAILHQAEKDALWLYSITQQIFDQIRKIPELKPLTIEAIQEILRHKLEFFKEAAKEDIQRKNYLMTKVEKEEQIKQEETRFDATVKVAKMGSLLDNVAQDALKHHGFEINKVLRNTRF